MAKRRLKRSSAPSWSPAASRGLGLGIARSLVAAGYRVIGAGAQANQGDCSAIAEAKRGKRGSLHFVAFDLGQIDEIPDLVRNLRQEFGPLFGLVNNAALGLDGALSLMHNTQIEEMVRVNTLVSDGAQQIRGAFA